MTRIYSNYPLTILIASVLLYLSPINSLSQSPQADSIAFFSTIYGTSPESLGEPFTPTANCQSTEPRAVTNGFYIPTVGNLFIPFKTVNRQHNLD